MLLTAGCSFVWGDELEGFDTNPPSHWELTFTHLLAKKMGVDYVNLGMCGSSNDRIFRDVVDYLRNPKKQNPTHVVVIWSAWQRAELVEEMGPEREASMGIVRKWDITQYSPQRIQVLNSGLRRDILTEYYTTAYDSKTDIAHGLTRMTALELICESLGIKLIQGVFHGRCWQNILKVITMKKIAEDTPGWAPEYVPEFVSWLKNEVSSLKPTSRVGMGKGRDMHSMAFSLNDVKPHGHPGEKTQVVFAEYLDELFNDANNWEHLEK